MTRITKAFDKLIEQNRKAVIPFIMAGDPNLDQTLMLMKTLADNGAEIIELGMPFSDPVADGPTIQAAGLRALKNNISLNDIFETVAKFRETHPDTAVVLMGYYNPVYYYGGARFCDKATDAGVDGLIIVDLPPEEESEFLPDLQKCNIDLIKLITPTSDDERLQKILNSAGGFVYYVSVSGTTGGKSAQSTDIEKAVKHIKNNTDLPVAVGFGIKNRDDVKNIHGFADAAVVGSALIDHLHMHDFSEDAAESFFSALTGL